MTIENLNTILNETNLPVAYNCFKTEQALPFICFLETGTTNLFADGKTYKIISDIAIELYTSKRCTTTETTLETVLDNHCIAWNKEITYLDDEQCFMVVYNTQI